MWTENSRGIYNKWDGVARCTIQVFLSYGITRYDFDSDLVYHEKLVVTYIYAFAGKLNQIFSKFSCFIRDCFPMYVQVNRMIMTAGFSLLTGLSWSLDSNFGFS